jgi:hypothetical protein
VRSLAAARIEPAATAPVKEKLTLVRRTDNAEYGRSAYSFAFASQDVTVHRNHVDLVYNGCGRLHISAGAENRIARVPGKRLEDVESLPTDGWQAKCIAPEKGALYVLELNHGDERARVKLLVTDVSEKEVKLEWEPLRVAPASEAGTLGICAGPHDCEP